LSGTASLNLRNIMVMSRNFLEARLVAVVRAPDPQTAIERAKLCVLGGIQWLEITCTVPVFEEVIRDLLDSLDPHLVTLGAGTVRSLAEAKKAVAAGAQFLVSPHTDAALVRCAQEAGILSCAGAYTPTEIMQAWQLGVDFVKLFPAHLGGPEYVHSLKQVFPEIPLFACGGVDFQNARDYLKAGASAVGIGSGLWKGEPGRDPVAAIRQLTKTDPMV
jgi:2-dehydro-3-deoxyphosphogluconate aldolase / (4S)-4-hydroxy-2-oxoglutarate aldolase